MSRQASAGSASRWWQVAAAAAMALATATAAAQAEPEPSGAATTIAPAQGTQDRTLNGHAFIREELIRSPFAATNVEANIIYGVGTATGSALTFLGKPIPEKTYSWATMSQILTYEKKLWEGISVGGGLTADLISGIDGPSVVVMGTQVGYGLFGRATAGQRFGPVQAAATFDVSYGPQYGIFILEAIDRFRTNPVDTIGKLGDYALASSNAWTLRPGFSTAWAPLRALGFTASADYQWISQDTIDGVVHGQGFEVGAAADWYFGADTSAPVALLGAWHWSTPLGSNSPIGHVVDYSVGVFYTGRPALVLGLELGYRSFPYRSLQADLTLAQFRVQYFW
jgi:hypothetical protein